MADDAQKVITGYPQPPIADDVAFLHQRGLTSISEIRAHIEERERTADELTAEVRARRQLVEWRCFHCGFVAADPEQARIHFGERDQEAACSRDLATARRLLDERTAALDLVIKLKQLLRSALALEEA